MTATDGDLMKPPYSLDDLFAYHPPPTDAVVLKHNLISSAHIEFCTSIVRIYTGPSGYDEVNEAGKAFAEAIKEHAPPSADRTAAIRCVRLACMALREVGLSEKTVPEVAGDLTKAAMVDALKAKWQANAAIALHYAATP